MRIQCHFTRTMTPHFLYILTRRQQLWIIRLSNWRSQYIITVVWWMDWFGCMWSFQRLAVADIRYVGNVTIILLLVCSPGDASICYLIVKWRNGEVEVYSPVDSYCCLFSWCRWHRLALFLFIWMATLVILSYLIAGRSA